MTEDVKLIGTPEKLIEKVYVAYRNCYSPKSAGKIWEELNKKIDYNNKCVHKCLDGNFRYFCKPQDDLQLDKERVCDFSPIKQEYKNKFSSSVVIDCKNERDNFKNYVMANEIKNKKMLDLILNYGDTHSSPLEHVCFVFTLDGSRAFTHQIVRHRHMSFSQKSQRYVNHEDCDFYTPETIKNNAKALEVYNNFLATIPDTYHLLTDHCGIPDEDARYVLPNACMSSMVASLNLRELIHLANLRLCDKAQKEIRDVVKQMCELVIEKEPWLAHFLQPKCYKPGYCDEKNGCGLFPQKVEHGRNYWGGGVKWKN